MNVQYFWSRNKLKKFLLNSHQLNEKITIFVYIFKFYFHWKKILSIKKNCFFSNGRKNCLFFLKKKICFLPLERKKKEKFQKKFLTRIYNSVLEIFSNWKKNSPLTKIQRNYLWLIFLENFVSKYFDISAKKWQLCFRL